LILDARFNFALTPLMFGNLLNSSGTTVNNYRYTGEQFDPNAGFYYLRARYYDQGPGRFTSVDPYSGRMHEPVTLHRYLYAGDNPVMNVDFSGLISAATKGVYIHQSIRSMYPHPGNLLPNAYLPYFQLIPDLADMVSKEVMEIKPASIYGISTGGLSLWGIFAR
jgi:RHS repeat-associated protein